jgi:hypothetical protein
VPTLRGGGAGAAGVTRLGHGGRGQRVGGKWANSVDDDEPVHSSWPIGK